jgi:hypothetical protein
VAYPDGIDPGSRVSTGFLALPSSSQVTIVVLPWRGTIIAQQNPKNEINGAK